MNDDLEQLGKKISAARGQKAASDKSESSADYDDSSNSRIGIQAGAELVVAIAAGTFFGYMLDSYFETKPVFLIILFFLGVCTGFYNVYRLTETGTTIPSKKRDNSDLPEG